MIFRSPWQSSVFVKVIGLVRLVLRPFGDLENRFIVWVATAQNRRVHRHLENKPAAKALLIMPRCVKKTGCRADVQSSLAQCLDCMQCPLGDVAETCDRHQVKALVAFRSHIAFEIARREQPDIIIASACHDRMVKALRSVPEFPALLAPLTGMDKMCVNATIDLDWLDEQLRKVTGHRTVHPAGLPHPVRTRPATAGISETS
jgi:hypothetical protein